VFAAERPAKGSRVLLGHCRNREPRAKAVLLIGFGDFLFQALRFVGRRTHMCSDFGSAQCVLLLSLCRLFTVLLSLVGSRVLLGRCRNREPCAKAVFLIGFGDLLFQALRFVGRRTHTYSDFGSAQCVLLLSLCRLVTVLLSLLYTVSSLLLLYTSPCLLLHCLPLLS
jgi:branched-subunit amino acid ABC-type transport system permease component